MSSLTVYDDPAAFLALVRPHLEAREAENGLLLGLLDAPVGAEPTLLARRHDGDETLAVAYLGPRNLVVSAGMGAGAGALVQAIADRRLPVPGIVGPKDDVEALAAAWSEARLARVAAEVEQGLYALHEVVPPAVVPGRMRAMADADVELVAAWVLGFHRDALPHEPYTAEEARANALTRPAAGMTYLWEVDGAPVAMAALARATRHGITVNAVYTPPENRGRGYASALVAQVSAEGLRRGKDFCVLYTDWANATTNALYQRLGYRLVGRSKHVRFT